MHQTNAACLKYILFSMLVSLVKKWGISDLEILRHC